MTLFWKVLFWTAVIVLVLLVAAEMGALVQKWGRL